MTLVCAVTLAVASGIACGTWINARLTSVTPTPSAAAAGRAPADRAPLRDAPEPPTVTEPTPAEHHEASPTTETPSPSAANGANAFGRGDAEPLEVEREAGVSAKAVGGRGAASKAEPRGVESKVEARRVASEDAERGGANEVKKRRGAREAGRRATAGRGVSAPCALYASAGSLTLRGGGSATLILGGPGEGGRVGVTTPDWSDIAVLYEGRAGERGWMRYTVRSISKRPGVYSVRFATPCGSQTIPVTVTRP